MARTQTMVQLSDELIALLDGEAARRGVSRSSIVREAIERLLADSIEATLTDAIVAGYRRTAPATPDEWGDLERAGAIAARETAQRLDAEERQAGFEPW